MPATLSLRGDHQVEGPVVPFVSRDPDAHRQPIARTQFAHRDLAAKSNLRRERHRLPEGVAVIAEVSAIGDLPIFIDWLPSWAAAAPGGVAGKIFMQILGQHRELEENQSQREHGQPGQTLIAGNGSFHNDDEVGRRLAGRQASVGVSRV